MTGLPDRLGLSGSRGRAQRELVEATSSSALSLLLQPGSVMFPLSLCLCPDPEAVCLVPHHPNHTLLHVPWIFLGVGQSSGCKNKLRVFPILRGPAPSCRCTHALLARTFRVFIHLSANTKQAWYLRGFSLLLCGDGRIVIFL